MDSRPDSSHQHLGNALAGVKKTGDAKKGWRLDARSQGWTVVPHSLFAPEFLPTTHLDLAKNSLTSIPEELVALELLEALILNNNEIATLPAPLFGLKKLQSLYIDNNKLSWLPDAIPVNNCLQELSMSNNLVTVVPSCFARTASLPSLEYLVLEGNPVSHDLPLSIITDPLHIVMKMEEMVEVSPGVFQGGQAHEMDRPLLQRHNITHIVSLNGAVPPTHGEHFVYTRINWDDSTSQAILPQLDEIVQFIDQALAQQGRVLIHCNSGISRSGAVAVAHTMKKTKISFDEAFIRIRQKRPACKPNRSFIDQLRQWKHL